LEKYGPTYHIGDIKEEVEEKRDTLDDQLFGDMVPYGDPMVSFYSY
jgi:chromate transport protein ChrA